MCLRWEFPVRFTYVLTVLYKIIVLRPRILKAWPLNDGWSSERKEVLRDGASPTTSATHGARIGGNSCKFVGEK